MSTNSETLSESVNDSGSHTSGSSFLIEDDDQYEQSFDVSSDDLTLDDESSDEIITPVKYGYFLQNMIQPTTVQNSNASLAVCTNLEKREVSGDEIDGDMDPQLFSTLEYILTSSVWQEGISDSPESLLQGICDIFFEFETPIGLLTKLIDLAEYDALEFLIDDSGSMSDNSDTKDETGRIQTRWAEAKERLMQMIKVISFVPVKHVTIRFFNRGDCITLEHDGGSSRSYFKKATKKINKAFKRPPNHGTPAFRVLSEALNRCRGRRVPIYFFCDGEPSGGKKERKSIRKLVCKRPNPQDTPITFISCTNEDDQVEWMKETEEISPFTSELDDFQDETNEVIGDQGTVFPFSKGFHLIAMLVGAMNPHDLDAMDESVPFTKSTLKTLMGYEISDVDYYRYFDGFMQAQQKRRGNGRMEKAKKKQNWEPLKEAFLTAELASDIPEVIKFKARLKKLGKSIF